MVSVHLAYNIFQVVEVEEENLQVMVVAVV
jgi:hypothetical protein